MFHSYVSFWLILLFLLKIVMRTIENWDHVPLHIIEKYRECDFSGINFGFAESNFSNLMQMWGKCVKQTAGILRWMDRVHLLGHSEVGRVGKNTNPKKKVGGYKYLWRLINPKGEKEEKEGKGRTGFCKNLFSSLWRRLLQRRAEKMSEALQHGFCVHLECTALETEHVARCTLYIIHCTSNTAQCTLRWSGLWVAWDWPAGQTLRRGAPL